MTGPPRYRLATYMIAGGDADEDVTAQSVLRGLKLGVDRAQIRMPGASGGSLERVLRAIVGRDDRLRQRLLVGDRLDIAMAWRLKGVHLPSHGFSTRQVRERSPEGFEIGVSTHSLAEAMAAARDGADFVVFGPVFETSSKPGQPGVGLEALTEVVRETPIPVYALGGIEPGRVEPVVGTGAHGVAGISMFDNEASVHALFKILK